MGAQATLCLKPARASDGLASWVGLGWWENAGDDGDQCWRQVRRRKSPERRDQVGRHLQVPTLQADVHREEGPGSPLEVPVLDGNRQADQPDRRLSSERTTF